MGIKRRIKTYLSFIGALGLSVLLAGCSLSRNVTTTPRSSTEQRLLVRALERAVAKLDLARFRGKRAFLVLHGLTNDRDFARAYLKAQLERVGVKVAAEKDQADLRLETFVPVLGVDRGETLLGFPAFAAPMIGVPIPEIALFKWVRNRGHVEAKVYAFDTDGRFVGEGPLSVGRSKYDEYTFFIFVSFGWSDLDATPSAEGQ